MMSVTRKCLLTGVVRTKTMAVTQDHIDEWLGGELIQNVMPHLSPDEREFLMTGIDWDKAFPDET